MAVGLTDGASRTTQVDPGQSSSWDTLLSSGIAETGIDPSVPFESDDPAASTPQSAGSGSSDGAGNGSPDAPATVTAGDDGQRATSDALPSARTPAPSTTDDPAGDPDPLATAKPFTFTVGDETRTVDGTYRIPGEGLVVPEDKVAHFELMASRAETLDRQNRDLYEQNQQWERLAAWPTKDAQGNAVTLSGREGYEAQRVLLSRSLAALQTIGEALSSDEAFAKLIGVTGEPGQEVVVRNPDALALLRERVDNAAYRAEQTVRAHLVRAAAPPPPPAPSAAEYAKPTIAALIAQHTITNLTQADQDFLAAEFPRYVTPDGKAVDPRFLDVMKDRASLRAEQIKASTAASTAGKFNGGMTAARGKPAATRPAPTAQPTASPAKVGKAAQWDNVLQSALSEIQLP